MIVDGRFPRFVEVRLRCCAHRLGYASIEAMSKAPDIELLRVPNLGRKSLAALRAVYPTVPRRKRRLKRAMPRPSKFTEDVKARIRALWAMKITQAEIAQRVGCGASSVQRIVREGI